MSCMQYLVWNTFGPIVSSIQYAFEWSDSTLAMMPNWGTITLVLGVFPMCWLLEQKGLKFSIVTASLLVAIGAVLRGITQEEYLFKVLSHLGSISNGIAGITVMSVPPALSATWFPPGERTLATFFGQVATQLGTGLSFALGPWLVPGKNLTDNVNEVKGQIYRYLWIEAGAAIGLFLLILLYFPKQPPSPPSASASLPRTDFQEGIKGLIKNKNALLCTVAYGLSGGTFLAWQSVMTLNFQSVGISDKESGRIGLVICAASFISGGIFAYGTDHLKKHMKTTLIILLMLEALSFFWLTLIISQVIAYSSWQLWVSSVAGSAFTFSLAPLFFEYTVELTYPAPEGLVGGLLAGFYNLVGTIFLSLFFAQNIGHLWVNYALVIAAIGKNFEFKNLTNASITLHLLFSFNTICDFNQGNVSKA